MFKQSDIVYSLISSSNDKIDIKINALKPMYYLFRILNSIIEKNIS